MSFISVPLPASDSVFERAWEGEGRNGTYIHFSGDSQAFPTCYKICELGFFFFLFGDTLGSWDGELAAPLVVGDGRLGGER